MAEGLMRRADEDRFANVLAAEVTETAANTLTYAEMELGIGIGSGVGILIDQIDYYHTAKLSHASGDGYLRAICLTNDISDLSSEFTNPRVLHISSEYAELNTNGQVVEKYPLQYKFTPALITAANRGKLYLAAQGVSQVAAFTLQCRIYFRYLKLTDRDYLELAESFALFG